MQRKFGIEIELNSFDNRNFMERPLENGELPEGTNDVASLIRDLGLNVCIQSWGHNHNNTAWICKPDASCGIEICSPVLHDKKSIFLVLDKLSKDKRIKQDNRCSFHIHVDVSDLISDNPNSSINLSCVLAWWVKCEHIFLDFAVPERKTNKYCKCIGLMDLFDHDEEILPFRLISKMSDKYLSLNTHHLFNRKRHSIEFRIFESTTDFDFASNCIDLVLNFIDQSIFHGLPKNYTWLDPNDFFDFFDLKDIKLKNWFLERLVLNCGLKNFGCFSIKDRSHALLQYIHLFQKSKIIEVEKDKYTQGIRCQNLILN